jgi:two-component sensor histidine kinase
MKYFYLSLLGCMLTIGQTTAQNATIDSLFKLANEKSSAGDVPESTRLFLEAQKVAEATHNTKALCSIQVGLGKLGVISQNNEAVEKAISQGETYCTACGDTLSLARLYLQKGVLQIKAEQYDAAIQTFRQSSDYYLIKHDTMGSANVLAKIGNVLEQQQKYQEAQSYYLKFYEVAKRDPEGVRFLTANLYLTGNYHYLHQPQKALYHNTVAKNLAQKLNANFEYANTLRYDALLYNEMGQYQKAFDALYEHYLPYYQDTLMSKDRLQEAEELKAKYETEQKETQIALQNEQLQRQNLQFRALAGGLALAIIAGIALFLLTQRLRKRNAEKEFLIKEIHHRVKNNLQILSSLLHLQSRKITDDAALDAVREGQNRVDAMGLIHQKLYMGDHVARVDMKDYFEQFGQNMLDSFGIEAGRISIQYDLQPMYLDVDTAIPLGLIVNELVTNSLKYAFPDNRQGTITIGLTPIDNNRLTLTVSDNGVGVSGAPELKNSTSFGTSLVQMLSKKLKGSPEIIPQEQGYTTRIVFEKPG